jgi:hypothetical protein
MPVVIAIILLFLWVMSGASKKHEDTKARAKAKELGCLKYHDGIRGKCHICGYDTRGYWERD